MNADGNMQATDLSWCVFRRNACLEVSFLSVFSMADRCSLSRSGGSSDRCNDKMGTRLDFLRGFVVLWSHRSAKEHLSTFRKRLNDVRGGVIEDMMSANAIVVSGEDQCFDKVSRVSLSALVTLLSGISLSLVVARCLPYCPRYIDQKALCEFVIHKRFNRWSTTSNDRLSIEPRRSRVLKARNFPVASAGGTSGTASTSSRANNSFDRRHSGSVLSPVVRTTVEAHGGNGDCRGPTTESGARFVAPSTQTNADSGVGEPPACGCCSCLAECNCFDCGCDFPACCCCCCCWGGAAVEEAPEAPFPPPTVSSTPSRREAPSRHGRKMAWRCGGATNEQLIGNLRSAGIITQERVFQTMRLVDRGNYVVDPAASYEV